MLIERCWVGKDLYVIFLAYGFIWTSFASRREGMSVDCSRVRTHSGQTRFFSV